MLRTGSALASLGLALVVSAASPSAPSPTPETHPEVRALAPVELDAALKGGTWLIVEFGGEHCIPCKAMQPVLQDLQAVLKGKARVHNFWIQQHPDVAQRFKIMVMPTQVVFNAKGQEVLRHMGYFPQAEFHQALKEKGLL